MTREQLAANRQVVERFVAILNERRLDDLPQVMATHVVDRNKIIHGEPDAPARPSKPFASNSPPSIRIMPASTR